MRWVSKLFLGSIIVMIIFSFSVLGAYVGHDWTELQNRPAGLDDGDTDTNTWTANSQANAGYVTAGGANNNMVWKTDGTGNPDWRIDATGAGGDDLGSHQAIQNIEMSGFWLSNDGGGEGVFVDTTGRVGIGDSTPSYPLDVWGTGRFTGSVRFSGEIMPDGATCADGEILKKTGANDWDCATGAGGDDLGDHTATQNVELNGNYLSNDGGNEGVRVTNGGNVGIGTASANARLSVNGAGAAGYGIYAEGSTAGVHGVDSDNPAVEGWLGVGGTGAQGFGTSQGVYGRDDGGSWGVLGSGSRGVVGDGTQYGVWGTGPTWDFWAVPGGGGDYGPFTGGHEVILSEDFIDNPKPGMIVSASGKARIMHNNGSISISTTMPTVGLSKTQYDKKVIGVLISEAEPPEEHWFNFTDERYAIINALGEGRVLVTNINGDIETGDYITTSDIPGYGMLQDDDLLHSYTLGKAIEDVDWDDVEETVSHEGRDYKVYLIACIYTSG